MISPAADASHKAIALGMLICPVGRCRAAVRGFNASNLRSTIRLKAIAHVRAQTIAARISPNVRHPGQPRLSRAATTIAARAKGSAKTVCENFTNDPHFWIIENIQSLWFRFPSAAERVLHAQVIEDPRHYSVNNLFYRLRLCVKKRIRRENSCARKHQQFNIPDMYKI